MMKIKHLTYLLLLSPMVFWACSKKSSWAPTYHQFNPVTSLTNQSFSKPGSEDLPWVRWNFPPETAEITELEKQLADMKAAGIAGVEIGQGGEPTLKQVEAVLKKANELGIKVSLR